MMDRYRSDNDSGAIAIIVAICALLLLGMAAFAVDFGNAFATKRQLSVAADSAAIAAARAVNNSMPPGTACNAATLQPIARSAAELANGQNDNNAGSIVSNVTVTCSADDVRITVSNERKLPTAFGSVFGADGYVPNRTATAQLFVPDAASGLRPIAACEATVLAKYQPSASPPVKNPFMVYVSKDSAVCGTATPGEWGFTNFLDQGTFGQFRDPGDPAYFDEEACTSGQSASSGGNAKCQAAWTDEGYGGPVYFPNAATGAGTGLAGNTGLAKSADYRAAFDALPDDIILLPVASAFSGKRLDITGVVTVRVCSAKRGGTEILGSHPDCAASRKPSVNPDLANWTSLKENEGALWVIPTNYATSGIADPRSGCFGDPTCDFGTRAVRLFQ